jgi:hypothetical protein
MYTGFAFPSATRLINQKVKVGRTPGLPSPSPAATAVATAGPAYQEMPRRDLASFRVYFARRRRSSASRFSPSPHAPASASSVRNVMKRAFIYGRGRKKERASKGASKSNVRGDEGIYIYIGIDFIAQRCAPLDAAQIVD